MHTLIIFTLSFITMIWSANHLITGACGISHYYRISPLIIGLSLVSTGLAFPEFLLSIRDAFAAQTHLVINHMIESNIANIGLVLGLVIILRPPKIHSSLFRHGFPLLFIIMLVIYLLMMNEYFSVVDGCVLLLGTIALITYMLLLLKHARHEVLHQKSFREAIYAKRTLRYQWFSLSIGFVVLPLSAYFFKTSLFQLADTVESSKVMIERIIIPMLTSMPVLITCIIAAIKDHDQLALGTILGSNMINLLAVLAFPGIIDPTIVPHYIVQRDIPIMLALTMVIFLVTRQSKRNLHRWHGGLLILIYGCYLVSLWFRG